MDADRKLWMRLQADWDLHQIVSETTVGKPRHYATFADDARLYVLEQPSRPPCRNVPEYG